MSMFVTPSSVVKRLRYIRDFYQGSSFPEFEVFGCGELEKALLDGQKNLPIALYVVADSGGGAENTIRTNTDIITIIDVILIVLTEDIRGNNANELAIGFKNFIVRALLSWYDDPNAELIPGDERLHFISDSNHVMEGHAQYIHTFTFSQSVEVGPACWEDINGSWEDLEWFNMASVSAEFQTGDGDENFWQAIARPNIPPLSG